MADRLATPLGTESNVLVSEELLVAQDDICSIGKTVDTLLMEFDQQAFEAYLSLGSEGSAAGRPRRMHRTGIPMPSLVHATNFGPSKQSLKDAEDPCHDFPQVMGGPSP